ncbi:T9SS type A sorting domain-containing protein [Flavobacterium selenitireducens]|uniref:T9SS type A sorting domain-containing protein n=1 Tax=Flavobacterium selenitireducens TaxID=2722704 RepID=UPI00168C0673|nr:T9SS type A sorting domain-containing protein [Flavobacterium selenitireducens]MBD3582994.1 T9SS type A sorting domain-containing protein [Flavobacterium selenitireducens]
MMKTILTSILFVGSLAFAQQTTLEVNGKILTTVSGQELTLRGLNYPIIDDGTISLANATQYQHKIDQAALTGANAIRIPWYTNGTHWRDVQTAGTISGYVNNGHLSNVLAYCHTKGMIPILEIHNATCSNDWNYFNNTVMPFWTNPTILSLIETHKQYLVINLANEFGYVRWAGNQAAAMTTFTTNYNAAIANLRNLGVAVPIMVDAPDCGQSSTELLAVAEAMVNADPGHNLIFSSHAYWFGYANSAALVEQKLNEADNTEVCFILGEVANTQDGDACGSISLATLYPTILTEACERNIGWLAWTFDQDCSAPREMTTNGEFNTLTAWGNDLVYNTGYGLLSDSPCAAAQLSVDKAVKNRLALFPNPATSSFGFSDAENIVSAEIFDLSGRLVREVTSGFESIAISDMQSGNYIVKIATGNSTRTFRLIKI